MTKVGEIALYDTNDIKKLFHIGNSSVLRLFKRKDFKAIKIGHKYWISEDNLRTFINTKNLIITENNIC